MTPYANLSVGLNPRRDPWPATLNAMGGALLMGGASIAALVILAPVRDIWDPTGPILSLPELFGQLASLSPDQPLQARLGIAIGIGAIAGVWQGLVAWSATPPSEPFAQTDAGDPRLYRGEFAEIALNRAFRNESNRSVQLGYFLAPYVALPLSLMTKNVMILAASGTGKSNICRSIATQRIEAGDFVVLHCTKGEVTAALRREDSVLISPTHRDGWAWDIGADIDGPAAAAEFAKDIVPTSDQPFWSDSARLVLTDVIMMLIAELQDRWGARELLLRLLEEPDQIRNRIAQLDLSASPLISTNDPEGTSKTIESIIVTMLSGALKTLRPMAYAWTNLPPSRRFSVKRALSGKWRGPKVLIVQSSAQFPALSTSVCGGILRRICQEVTSPKPQGRSRPRVTMVLDEFKSLGKIEDFDRSLSVAREHELSAVIALQSVWQLNFYGESAKVLSDLFQIKIYGRHVAGEGADDAARRLGRRKIEGTKANRHPAAADKRLWVPFEREQPIFSASQLQKEVGLFHPSTPREHIRALVHYAGDAFLLNWPPTLWEAQSDGNVPAEWTLRVAAKADV